MGEVWRGTDTALDRPIAVKLLKHEYADDATFRSRFETEARHAAVLHHPGVAAVYDFGESQASGVADGSGIPRPFLVMELVDGQPLSALLRAGEPLDPDAVRDLLAQAGDAIGAAHRAGIVHRDIKPANLLVTPDRQIKITDFGIARAAEGLGLTGTGQVMGTPQYLSPEQARGEAATPASDVYSLGVVAFECLAGRRPFEAESPVATALAHIQQPGPRPAGLGARRPGASSCAGRWPRTPASASPTAPRSPPRCATRPPRRPQIAPGAADAGAQTPVLATPCSAAGAARRADSGLRRRREERRQQPVAAGWPASRPGRRRRSIIAVCSPGRRRRRRRPPIADRRHALDATVRSPTAEHDAHRQRAAPTATIDLDAERLRRPRRRRGRRRPARARVSRSTPQPIDNPGDQDADTVESVVAHQRPREGDTVDRRATTSRARADRRSPTPSETPDPRRRDSRPPSRHRHRPRRPTPASRLRRRRIATPSRQRRAPPRAHAMSTPTPPPPPPARR